jgi:hypothetical protein
VKRYIALAVAAALATVNSFYAGCDSSEGPSEPVEGNPAPFLSGTVGPSGGTLTSDDGRLSIFFPQNALTADTQIRIEQVEVGDADPAFAGFDARAALRVEPRGLSLAEKATLSFTFPITATSVPGVSTAAAPQEKETIVDLIFGLIEDGKTGVSIPDQKVDYDLEEGEVKVDILTLYLDNLCLGRPVYVDIPEEGDDFGVLGVDQWTMDPELKLGTPFKVRYTLRVGHVRTIDAASMVMIDPPTIDLETDFGDGDPVESIIEELSDGFRRHKIDIEYTPKKIGHVESRFNLGFELEYDPEQLDLPEKVDTEDPGDVRYTIRYKALGLDVLDCDDPPCDSPSGRIDIATGLNGQRGLSAAFWKETLDPPPLGDGPWLFVTGDSAVQWYRLSRDPQGRVSSTELINELSWIGSTGTVPVAQGIENRTRALFLFGGTSGGWRTHWNDQVGDWGAIVLASANVTDASSYGNTSDSRGWVWANGSSVQFVEYDSSSRLFFQPQNTTLFGFNFPEANGGPATAAVSSDIEDVIVVMDGKPAEIWWHDRADVTLEAIKLGVAGNGAKEIRTQNGIFAISNNGSNSVTIGTWNGPPSIKGTEVVGAGPWGIDVVGLTGGGAAVLCTSESENTYTVITVDAGGAVISKETNSLPGSGSARYAVFVPGQVTYIAFSCPGTKSVALVETSLQTDS